MSDIYPVAPAFAAQANIDRAAYERAYAQAQDNLCTLADSFLTYRGERSRRGPSLQGARALGRADLMG